MIKISAVIITFNENINIRHMPGDLLHIAYDGIKPLYEKAYADARIYACDKQGTSSVSVFKILYKTFYSFVRNFVLKLGFTYGYDGPNYI